MPTTFAVGPYLFSNLTEVCIIKFRRGKIMALATNRANKDLGFLHKNKAEDTNHEKISTFFIFQYFHYCEI